MFARACACVLPSLQVDELARLCAYHSERIVDLANRTGLGSSHHAAHTSDAADAALDRRLAVMREQLLHEVCQLGAESSLRSQALTDRARLDGRTSLDGCESYLGTRVRAGGVLARRRPCASPHPISS